LNKIQLRKGFFPDNILFWQWLPDGLENALNVDIDGIKFEMCVHLKYKHTSDLTIDTKAIHNTNHWIKAFFIYLTVPVDDTTDSKLYQLNPPEELKGKIAKAIRKFLSLLYGIVRNEIGQFWLSNYHEIDSLSDGEILLNTEILNQEKKWGFFCVGTVKGISTMPSTDISINKERWFQLKDLIEQVYKSDLGLVFFRNAEKHLKDYNLRMAIVEACIALERTINVFIKDHLSSEKYSELKPVIDRNSLTDKVNKLLFELLPDNIINESVIETCSEAVGVRNNIVHNSQVRNIDYKKVKNYLNAIKRIIHKLTPRKFSIFDENSFQ